MTESDDLRAFIRDLMARFDRGMDAVLARMEADREESRRYFERYDAKLDEILAEGRAGRQALFHLLDRLDGNGGPATAG